MRPTVRMLPPVTFPEALNPTADTLAIATRLLAETFSVATTLAFASRLPPYTLPTAMISVSPNRLPPVMLPVALTSTVSVKSVVVNTAMLLTAFTETVTGPSGKAIRTLLSPFVKVDALTLPACCT